MSPQQVRLPDFLADWPYERRLNPYCAEVSKAASAWIASYGLLTPKSQRAFELCDSGLLASLAYPNVGKAQLRVICDALNVVFLFDDYSDLQDRRTVRAVADTIMDALHDPLTPCLKDHSRFGEITRSFWSRALEVLSPSCARRFVEAFEEYCNAIVEQAEDRSRDCVRDMESYLVLRRNTIGAKLAFALLEDGLDIPRSALDDPIVVNLTNTAIDIISLCNDAYSYDIEQSRGDEAHNMLTCIMHSNNVELQESMTILENHIACLTTHFLSTKDELPEWTDEIDASVIAYIDGIGTWVRANDTWSFESQRYFGPEGIDLQRHRMIKLRPRRDLCGSQS